MKKLLKLTGGSFAGRKLYVPETGVRPATNRTREAIFSTLQSYFPGGMMGRSVLDLFAGTGSLGLEALSRGADRVTFVDSRAESVRAIRRNLDILGFEAEVVRDDAGCFIKGRDRIDFELIFMDPPYSYRKCGVLVKLLRSRVPADMKVVLVYERAFQEELPDFGEGILNLKRKRYGQTELLYYSI